VSDERGTKDSRKGAYELEKQSKLGKGITLRNPREVKKEGASSRITIDADLRGSSFAVTVEPQAEFGRN